MAESLPKPVPLVLLHGWGFDHRIWDDLLPLLQQHSEVIALDVPGFGAGDAPQADINHVTKQLLARLPPRCVLLGWSLGGLLATHIAIHHPQRVEGLITVGSNLKWIAETGSGKQAWPGAVLDNFSAFFENLVQDFESTKQHFCGVIARGDSKEKAVARMLRTKLSSAPQENFLAGLRLLDSIDNRTGYASLKMPGLHVFGDRDVMVPLNVGEQMKAMNRGQLIQVMPDCAHQPFLAEAEKFALLVSRFIQGIPYQLDKKRVAQSFSKAAMTYDNAAQLQREIGGKLLAQLPVMQPQTVLDLGCGTGAFSTALQQRYRAAQIVSLDIAEGMLVKANQHAPSICGVCADAEYLPFADDRFDLVYSNLAIQWCQDYPVLFSGIYRVMKPDGVALISTFVDGTLCELQQAWQQVDSKIHVNQFTYAENIKETASQAGFYSIDLQQQTLVKHYGSVKQLTQELKAIGAHNLNAGRAGSLTGKRKLQQMMQAYELFRLRGQLPVHYEVVYLVLRK
jgi:malonyl-CoA O-methyltransferase